MEINDGNDNNGNRNNDNTGNNNSNNDKNINNIWDGEIYIYRGGKVHRRDKKVIEHVVVADYVTRIECQAFEYCQSLRDIQFSSSTTDSCCSCSGSSKLREIGDRAFLGCSSIFAIVLPPSVEKIGTKAFYRCYNLTTFEPLSVPSSSSSTTTAAATTTSSTTAITSLREIGKDAFNECYALEDIEFPSSVEKIGARAFSYCGSLTRVTFAPTIDDCSDDDTSKEVQTNKITRKEIEIDIGRSAFDGCWELRTVSLMNCYHPSRKSIKRIPCECFSGCGQLSSIELPTCIEVIGKGSFFYCRGLETINLPSSSVVSIGPRAFESSGLESFHLDDDDDNNNNDDDISSSANAAAMSTASSSSSSSSSGLRKIGKGAFRDCCNLQTVTLSKTSIRIIGKSAFQKCRYLKRITLPSSLVDIHDYALAGCSNLTIIDVCNPTRTTTTTGAATAPATTGRKLTGTSSSHNTFNDEIFPLSSYVKLPTTLYCIGTNTFDGCDMILNNNHDTNNNKYNNNNNNNITKQAILFLVDTNVMNIFLQNVHTYPISLWPYLLFNKCNHMSTNIENDQKKDKKRGQKEQVEGNDWKLNKNTTDSGNSSNKATIQPITEKRENRKMNNQASKLSKEQIIRSSSLIYYLLLQSGGIPLFASHSC